MWAFAELEYLLWYILIFPESTANPLPHLLILYCWALGGCDSTHSTWQVLVWGKLFKFPQRLFALPDFQELCSEAGGGVWWTACRHDQEYAKGFNVYYTRYVFLAGKKPNVYCTYFKQRPRETEVSRSSGVESHSSSSQGLTGKMPEFQLMGEQEASSRTKPLTLSCHSQYETRSTSWRVCTQCNCNTLLTCYKMHSDSLHSIWIHFLRNAGYKSLNWLQSLPAVWKTFQKITTL